MSVQHQRVIDIEPEAEAILLGDYGVEVHALQLGRGGLERLPSIGAHEGTILGRDHGVLRLIHPQQLGSRIMQHMSARGIARVRVRVRV